MSGKLGKLEGQHLAVLELIGAGEGTTKLHGTDAYSTKPFKAVCFSEASEITAVSDGEGNDKDDYCTDTTYTFSAGDILTAFDWSSSANRFKSIELASGSAMLIH
jgi:hypothetical protein